MRKVERNLRFIMKRVTLCVVDPPRPATSKSGVVCVCVCILVVTTWYGRYKVCYVIEMNRAGRADPSASNGYASYKQ